MSVICTHTGTAFYVTRVICLCTLMLIPYFYLSGHDADGSLSLLPLGTEGSDVGRVESGNGLLQAGPVQQGQCSLYHLCPVNFLPPRNHFTKIFSIESLIATSYKYYVSNLTRNAFQRKRKNVERFCRIE